MDEQRRMKRIVNPTVTATEFESARKIARPRALDSHRAIQQTRLEQ